MNAMAYLLIAACRWRLPLPETVEQVQNIVKICAEFNVPVVARGAGTGLSGGALPHEHGIVLSLARLRKQNFGN